MCKKVLIIMYDIHHKIITSNFHPLVFYRGGYTVWSNLFKAYEAFYMGRIILDDIINVLFFVSGQQTRR